VNSQKPRHPKYSQFRGHAKVTVTDPLGNQSVNFFAQDDLYVGRATEIRQRDGSGKNYTKTLNDFTRVNYDTYQSFTYAGDRIDFIKLNWSQVETYDGNNANPKTRRTEYAYDSYGNVSETREKDETGAVYRKTFKEFYPADEPNGAHLTNKTARVYVTDGNGNRVAETRYLYDNNSAYNQAPTLGELKQALVTTDGAIFFASATYGYDSFGNVTSVTDARGKTTTTTFDAQYHLFAESIDPPLLPATTTSYDKLLGLTASSTDANGAVTSTTYDVFGRRTSITTPLDQGYAATAQYAYTLGSANVPTKVEVKVRRDLGGNSSADYQFAWYFLDGLGRVIQKQAQAATSGQIILVNTSYDERGKVKYVSQPYAVSASGGIYVTPDWGRPKFVTAYDPLGRVQKVTHPDGTFTTTSYDHWLTTSTDANGHKQDFLADAFGRTTRVREYQANAVYATTTYAYDRLDRLTDTWDAANNNTHLTYDWLGRKTQMQDPDMGTWTYVYDTAGNLTAQRDARNASVCFNYDDLNRVTTKTARNGTNCSAPISYAVTYGYDSTASGNKGWGRRTSLTDNNGSQTWLYDLHGRVTSTAQSINGGPATYTTSFTYDAMERVRTMTYPDGEVVTSVYNNQGLPDTLSGANPYVSATTYNAASQLDSLTFGNSALTDYVYNSQNLRLTDIVTTKSGNTLLNLHYGFDNVGNILSVQDTARGETTNYAYDDLDRLLSASVTTGGNQYNRSWTYDALGNMQTRVEQGVTTNYSYDPNHKHAVASAGSATYQYDANGSMTNRNGDALTYDVENRLTSVTKAGVTTSFAYNGDGTRVKRSVSNAGTTYYIGNIYEVWVPNSGTTTFNKYYYFGTQRIAAKIAGTLFYFQGDHLGSSSVAMTQAGTSFYSRQTYFPYGAQRTTEGSALPTDYTFTGQKSDDSTGLMFYGARYYDPALGRFTQPDTIVPNLGDPQSLNRYSYVQNNPVRYTDPTGHMMDDGLDGGCGICGPSTPPSNGGNTPSETDAQSPASTPSDQTTNEGTCQGPRRKCDPNWDPELSENPITAIDSPTVFIAEGAMLEPWQLQYRISAWLEAHPDYQPSSDPNYDGFAFELGMGYFRWQAERVANSHEPFTIEKAISLATPVIIAAGIRGAPEGMGDSGGPTAGKRVTSSQRAADLEANKAANPRGRYWCTHCGFENTDASMFQDDHIVPRSQGGNTNPGNRRILCVGCNTSAQEGWPPKAGSDWATKYKAWDMQP
jgi:RHS repeat-associated protein